MVKLKRYMEGKVKETLEAWLRVCGYISNESRSPQMFLKIGVDMIKALLVLLLF